MRRLGPLAAMAVMVSGCAGHWSRSYDRWEGLWSGPYRAWALCIDERSNAYLQHEAPPAWYKGPTRTTSQIIFTWVLADCAGLMHGPGWDNLKPAAYERLIGDAWQHFLTVDARIQGDIEASIV
ncbi:hypothetical protein OF829_15530 [Sphingomonas sp. LB-2]|uniref:hypothetical protein n=1 Tax=Sphingomonas caeni TaxID=2984949 RepID=UPI00222E68DC|nr:hypothetical protein [Sphingomonas caeni]MCW3848646.1 hypothetical protein [Sphingomonas caeni]